MRAKPSPTSRTCGKVYSGGLHDRLVRRGHVLVAGIHRGQIGLGRGMPIKRQWLWGIVHFFVFVTHGRSVGAETGSRQAGVRGDPGFTGVTGRRAILCRNRYDPANARSEEWRPSQLTRPAYDISAGKMATPRCVAARRNALSLLARDIPRRIANSR